MTDFGKKVRERREELGITQEELAERLGYKTKSSITKIESGVNDPVLSKVSAFAEALNVPVSYFMGWQENRVILSPDDAFIIKNYHLLNEANQKAIKNLMLDLIEAQNNS